MADTVVDRLAAVVQLLVSASGLLGIVWVGLNKVSKPYLIWRRSHLGSIVSEILAPTLERMEAAVEREEGYQQEQQRIIERQTAIFEDLDLFLKVALDNRDRMDETNDLLDQMFSLERRVDLAQRKEIDQIIAVLRKRALLRRRRQEDEPVIKPAVIAPPPPETKESNEGN